MKAGSTGFFKVQLNIDGDFDSVIFTLKSEKATRTKEYPGGVALLNNNFYIPLGQGDTEALQGYVWVEAQINFSDGRVRKSENKRIYIGSTLATKIMETQFPDGADMDDEDIADLELLLEDLVGNDGYSPTVTVTTITGGHRITITDVNGDHTFDVFNGSGGGEVDPQAIADAVEAYMQEHNVPSAEDVEQIVAGYVEEHKAELKGDKGDKGDDGATGATPNITVTASVDNNTGTPSVEVTKTGTAENPNINLAFHNLKGAEGGGGGSSDVVINPILSGDEDIATGIEVNGEKYTFPNTNTYGFTPAQIAMFEGILRAAVYSSDQSSAITAFIDSLNEQPVVPKVLTSITAVLNNPTVEQGQTYTPNATVTAHYDDSSSAVVTSGVSYSTIDTSTTGAKTLTISYTENEVTKTTTATVTVQAEPIPVTLTNISATKTKVSYTTSEVFSTDDVTVTAHYSNGTSANVTSSASIGTVDITTEGNKTLDISYTEDGITKTTTIAITVTASGGKTYLENAYSDGRRINAGVIGNHTGDALSYVNVESGKTYETDYSVKTHFYFGTNVVKDTVVEEITFPYTASSNGMLIRTDSTGAHLDLKVYEVQPGVKTLESISATKTKTTYAVGEAFSGADVVVTAHYSDNTTADVTSSATIGTVDTSTEGNKTLSISYTEDGITESTSIAITVGTVPSVQLAYKYGKRTQVNYDVVVSSSKAFACTIGGTDTSAPLIADIGIHAIPRGSLTHYTYSGENTKVHGAYYTVDDGTTWYSMSASGDADIPSEAVYFGICVVSNDEATSASTYSTEIESGLTLS